MAYIPPPKRSFTLNEYFKDGYVLIADDNSSLRKTIRSMARQFDVNNVVEVEDGDVALRVLKQNDKRCLFVLLDWIMPRLSGIEVVREIRADNEIGDLPILMVTAEADPAQIVRAAEEGINGYITKPFVGKAFEQKIYSILEARANPPQHVKLLMAAEGQLRAGNHEKAYELFESSLSIKETARVMVHMGDILKSQKNADQAMAMYSNAMSNNPRFLKAYSQAADLHDKQGNVEAALGLLTKALEISPNNPERLVAVGKLHLKNGSDSLASEAFTAAVKLDSKTGIEIAEELLRSDKGQLAETFLRKNSTKVGQNAFFFNKMGIALRKQGKWREAITEYENAIKLDPGDENIYFNMARAYMEGKDYFSAHKYLTMAIKLNPHSKEFKEELEVVDKLRGGGGGGYY